MPSRSTLSHAAHVRTFKTCFGKGHQASLASNTIRSYLRVQAVRSLSSGEASFSAFMQAAPEELGAARRQKTQE